MLKKAAAVFLAVAVATVLSSPTSSSNDETVSSGPGWDELLVGHGIFTTGKLNAIQSRSNEDVVKIEELRNLLSDSDNLKTVYNNYMTLFEKTDDLYQGRLDHFKDQLLQIASHNLEADAGKHPWWMGVNYFTDMTASELKDMTSGFQAFDNSSDVEIGYDSKFHGVAAPDSLNYTAEGVVGFVKNQAPCGSCAMFASAAVLESAIARTFGVPPPALSTQELVDCSVANYCCEKKGRNCQTGTIVSSHYDYMTKYGISTWEDYPYLKTEGPCQRDSKARVAKITKDKQHAHLSEANLKQLLADKGPLQAHIKQRFPYAKGVMTTADCTDEPYNHGVLLVGYGKDSDSGLDYWVIKNSYGPLWGEAGYMRIERNKIKSACRVTEVLYSVTPVLV